jgi:predicted MFS family arabinose efflux permease
MTEILRLTRDNRLLALALLLWGIGDGLFFYIQPLYLKELGANPVAIGGILAAAGVASAVSHIPAGWFADHFGRKPVLLAGWVFGLVGGVMMYLARSLPLFVAGLLLYMFTGFVLAPINAYAAEARGAQSIQRALSLLSAGFAAGALFSPAIGGLIARTYGLRTVFGLATLAFAVSTVALLPLTAQPITPPAEGHTRYGSLFRNQRFLGFLVLVFVALVAMDLGMPFAQNFVVEVRRFDVATVGLLGSLNALGSLLINVTLGHSRPRRGFLLALGLVITYLVLLLYLPGLGWLAVAYFLRGGWNLARNMANAQVGQVVGPEQIGLAFGLMETVVATVLTVAPLAAGFLYAGAPPRPFEFSLLLTALAAGLVWRFAPHQVDAVAAGEPPAIRDF